MKFAQKKKGLNPKAAKFCAWVTVNNPAGSGIKTVPGDNTE